MASPPEVHSALLNSGPGPGALLTAAAAWASLSTEYESAADDLLAVLGAVQGAAWHGPSAESYVAAHLSYLAWLQEASAASSETAARAEAVAGAYAAALAAMPTLAELAANHATHAALLATNFFGVNTIPIAVNEADYTRMWVQAATTMNGYQAASDAALMAAPQLPPPPKIVQQIDQSLQNLVQAYQNFIGNPQLNPLDQFENLVNNPQLDAFLEQFGIGNATVAHDPVVDNVLDNFVANILRNFGYNWNPLQGTLNGLDYDDYSDPTVAAFWVARTLELSEDFQQFFVFLQTNPVLAIQYLVSLELFDWPTHLAEVFTLTSQPAALAAALPVVAAPLASASGLAGLAGLAALPSPIATPPALVPLAAPALLPVAGLATVSAPAAAPAPSSAPAPNPPAGSAPSSVPPAPGATGGTGFAPPYAAAPPGIGFGSGMGAKASAATKRQAAQPDSAAATAAAAREAARARRRRQARSRDHGDEFMDMNVDVDPDWIAQSSGRGAGRLGLVGTLADDKAGDATGLATLADDYGGGPKVPMLPGSWAGEPGAGQDEVTPPQ
ncbi:PPE family protein [Mycobacterium asiaticum]|uniref:PPE family domain-containing protein n=1 Tax=Mycobacterium asiaticum TaxID=1790 RepID=A0A1A3D037_MYCAS|nr:PPE family protein [Mycobacterium asiaticum]OBI92409.1 hypothetical protein A9X01_09345 [Mycobacterium asiaticum]